MTDLPLTGAEPVDVLLEDYPQASLWLNQHGVICMQCGEVFWGPLQELCAAKGIVGDDFTNLIAQLNAFLRETS